MKYLLDTNAWVAFIRQSQPNLTQRLQSESPADVHLCSVTLAELFYGAARSLPAHQPNNLALIAQLQQTFPSLPFDDRCADEYGKLRAHLERLGTPIGPNDFLIASIALANQMILVTHNTAEFGRVPGLTLEDWQ
jgi:tRNA(fMet)-specific endonuclease VapC